MEFFKNARAPRGRMTKKDSDYLRFRPYHAFTAQQPNTNRWNVLRQVAVILGFLALLIFSGKFLIFALN